MKTICTLLFSFMIAGAAMGQERFPLPEYSADEKLEGALYQWWGLVAASIDYAKSKGSDPYEYGRYLGMQYAPTWDQEAGFDGFVNGMIWVLENLKTDGEGPLEVQEEVDGSVMLRIPLDSWKKYFGEEMSFATFDEAMKFMLGLFKEVATSMNSGITICITEWNVGFVLTPPEE